MATIQQQMVAVKKAANNLVEELRDLGMMHAEWADGEFERMRGHILNCMDEVQEEVDRVVE